MVRARFRVRQAAIEPRRFLGLGSGTAAAAAQGGYISVARLASAVP